MQMAGRVNRRIRGYAKAHNVPVIDCRRDGASMSANAVGSSR